jgi:drug/metabolite transporter (DMT)-like permease
MLWFWLSVLAYFLFAINHLWDRYLLTKLFPDTLVYAFYAGMLSGVIVIAAPFLGFPFGSILFTISAIFCGAVFVAALVANYIALQKFEASRIVPAIGGPLPLFTLGLTLLVFPGEKMAAGQVISFFLFVLASITITAQSFSHIFSRSFGYAAAAALLFGIYFVSLRFTYEIGPSFWAGFLWTRLGGVLAAVVIFLAAASVRKTVLAKRPSGKTASGRARTMAGLLFLSNKGLGATATVIQNGAVFLAPPLAVSLINSLQGTQYLFLMVIAYFVSTKLPGLLKESFAGKALLQKAAALALFTVGTLVLIYYK